MINMNSLFNCGQGYYCWDYYETEINTEEIPICTYLILSQRKEYKKTIRSGNPKIGKNLNLVLLNFDCYLYYKEIKYLYYRIVCSLFIINVTTPAITIWKIDLQHEIKI